MIKKFRLFRLVARFKGGDGADVVRILVFVESQWLIKNVKRRLRSNDNQLVMVSQARTIIEERWWQSYNHRWSNIRYKVEC